MYAQMMIDDDDDMAIKEGPQYLLFYLHSHLFALRGEVVTEIVELPEITKVPGMRPCVKGVCNIRGSVVGVIDTARRLMQHDCLHTPRTSLVIVKTAVEGRTQKIGLIIDEVYEVEVFESDELQATPGFGLPIDPSYVEAMANYEGGFIPVLSLDAVVDIEALSRWEGHDA